jgi:hypothetical protein
MLNESPKVEKIDKDSGWTDEDVGKVRGVNFSEVTREETELQVHCISNAGFSCL